MSIPHRVTVYNPRALPYKSIGYKALPQEYLNMQDQEVTLEGFLETHMRR
jgi:hypothetical protein